MIPVAEMENEDLATEWSKAVDDLAACDDQVKTTQEAYTRATNERNAALKNVEIYYHEIKKRSGKEFAK